MSIKDVLKPFKRRLTAEAWIRSLVLGGMIAACVAVVLGCVHFFLPKTVTEMGILLAFGGVFLFGTGILFFTVYRPTPRDTARRLDQLGMSERVETMLEYQQSTTPVALLQRAETIDRLRGVKKKDIKFQISKTFSLLCGVLVVCATVLLFVPDIHAFVRHPLVGTLEDMANGALISEEFKQDLEDILEDLEEELEQSENQAEMDDAIEDAMEKINESVEKENSHKELGGLLQNYEDLKELGEAIEKGDKEGVSAALDNMGEAMKDNPDKQQSVAEQLQNALGESQTEADNDLYEALENMKNGLQDPEQPTDETLDKAEMEINAALDKQQNAQMLGDQMKEQLGNQMSSGQKGEAGQEEEGAPQGNGSPGDASGGGGDQSSSSGSNSTPGNGVDSGGQGATDGDGLGGNQTNMKDYICDPQAGEVMYGNVYAAYVADFLAAAENGELPADVVEAMNAYLESLKN